MSDRMTPIPFPELMHWILEERKQGTFFALHHGFVAPPGEKLHLFGEHLETPFGPAAGPHTQLAQNILAAYYAGARFFELKTVQTLDGEDLPVSKPCILAEDECYNVEWSTELRVQEAFDEYVKAWFALKLLSHEFGWGQPDGFMFNMSVGYNYEGITSEKIDAFIEGLKNASATPIWAECLAWTRANMDRFERVDEDYLAGISPRVCTSITLSTLHGCPPQEIERIAAYLLHTKKLHTFVKCNPTLLGYDFARRTMDQMGYDYLVFDDFHFNDDLQYRDAVPMFRRLQDLAAENCLTFGLKLTNTFPVGIARGELPGEEMYMSGRSLYPLTMELARRISEDFDGQMRLSFSGGVEAFNLEGLVSAGIWPVTMATTLLKPGGYQRFTQMARSLSSRAIPPFQGVSVGRVTRLAEHARHDPQHLKALKPAPRRKLDTKVPLVDCFTAPCTHGCPIRQDIPEYIELFGKGDALGSLRLITEKNPLPFMTGTVCNHRCMDKCTRNFYEEPVSIRNVKLQAAKAGFEALMAELTAPPKTSPHRVAVVGGGPAGMSTAFFLGRQGVPVTLFERQERLGGIVRYVVPEFRIPDQSVDCDVALMQKMDVEARTGQEAPGVQELKDQGFTHVVLTVGAQAPGALRLEKGEPVNVIDFLQRHRAGTLEDLGTDVLVIGGGNTAMDAARAAKRTPGVQRSRVVYRRTRRFMPADEEELHLALADGVEFLELLAPISWENGQLLCRKMELGPPDASGRRTPLETDQTVSVPCTALIAAVGEKVDPRFFQANGLAMTDKGRVQVNPATLETSVPGVYVAGDAHLGPATIVEAIADARRVVDAIAGPYPHSVPGCTGDCHSKHGILKLYDDSSREVERCLQCGDICENCVQVCPNRAYMSLTVQGLESPQILHLDRMCNECGNCTAFCPYDSSPYLEKLTLFSTEKEFEESAVPGFFHLGGKRFRLRVEQTREVDLEEADPEIDPALEKILWAVLTDYAWLLPPGRVSVG